MAKRGFNSFLTHLRSRTKQQWGHTGDDGSVQAVTTGKHRLDIHSDFFLKLSAI